MGHHNASFTLHIYIHLLDEDVPAPTFFDDLKVGHTRATQAAENGRTYDASQAVEVAV